MSLSQFGKAHKEYDVANDCVQGQVDPRREVPSGRLRRTELDLEQALKAVNGSYTVCCEDRIDQRALGNQGSPHVSNKLNTRRSRTQTQAVLDWRWHLGCWEGLTRISVAELWWEKSQG